jgi:hypothetical protein
MVDKQVHLNKYYCACCYTALEKKSLNVSSNINKVREEEGRIGEKGR